MFDPVSWSVGWAGAAIGGWKGAGYAGRVERWPVRRARGAGVVWCCCICDGGGGGRVCWLSMGSTLR